MTRPEASAGNARMSTVPSSRPVARRPEPCGAPTPLASPCRARTSRVRRFTVSAKTRSGPTGAARSRTDATMFDMPPPRTITSGSSTLMTLASARAIRSSYRARAVPRRADRPAPQPATIALRSARRSRCAVRSPPAGPDPRETSRCSRGGRNSTPVRVARRQPATAADCGPTPPRSRCGPVRTCAADDDAGAGAGADDDAEDDAAPAAAPSAASETAKQFASLAIRTSRPRRRSRSARSGWPISQTELAFLTRPVAAEMVPGMPTPTDAREPARCSSASTERRHRLDGRRVVAARRLDAHSRDFVAAAHRDALDLGPTEINPDAHTVTTTTRRSRITNELSWSSSASWLINGSTFDTFPCGISSRRAARATAARSACSRGPSSRSGCRRSRGRRRTCGRAAIAPAC